MGEPFRIEPRLPVTAYKSYVMVSPPRPATCQEAGCQAHANGWVTVVDERTELGQAQAYYIRTQSGRGFAEHRREDGLTGFRFEPGQRCFTAHRMPAEGRERFLVRDGDLRGNPTGRVAELGPQGWVDDFGEHQERLAEQLERG